MKIKELTETKWKKKAKEKRNHKIRTHLIFSYSIKKMNQTINLESTLLNKINYKFPLKQINQKCIKIKHQ